MNSTIYITFTKKPNHLSNISSDVNNLNCFRDRIILEMGFFILYRFSFDTAFVF